MAAPTPTPTPTGPITTPLTRLLRIRHPILLAGMARASSAPLAAAVSNAGGLGCIGGLGYSPVQLGEMIHELRSLLSSPTLPFGVDLALPQVGGGARATNHDYTKGQLAGLIDVIVAEKVALFVSAVGVPPAWVVDRLHGAGCVVMNMVGSPRHATKALEGGVDMVCAQGGEGGGHTGEIPNAILVPAVVDVARRFQSPLTGERALVVAAGGVVDGRGLASSLMQGAVGVWVGTRFVASEEAGCSEMHKRAVVEAGWGSTARTLVVSGRPLRVETNAWVRGWEARPEEIRGLVERGVVPMERDLEEGREVDFPFLMGMCAAVIAEVKPAKAIVGEMVEEAVRMLELGGRYLGTDEGKAKL